jgi:purine-nucleoside/S-methyl-5'-thioadenosine phosphorylase / adenosine deaminase
MKPVVEAQWPAPPGVRAFTTLRHGAGASLAPFDHFNLGNRYAADGDDWDTVEVNRRELVERMALPASPHWLRQVHGTDVLRFDAPASAPWGAVAMERPQASEPVADASVTSVPGVVLGILTADCLPVVFAAKDGSEIATAHAGWPGLSEGMLEATLAAMRTRPSGLMAWIGPAAGPQRYEVGGDVFEVFVSADAGAASAFVPTRPGHWLADLPALARRRMTASGMSLGDIHGGDLCTIGDPSRFFSHRRDGRSGRIATLAWMER